jgi:molybdopterin-guanine dinucleotide biosynthesis protein A
MTLTALLLVGGLSSRMGRDKATLLFDGEPLWARQIALLRELRPETILISVRAVPSWVPPDVTFVLDQPPSRGPLSGIAAALASMQSSHLFALAVDLPRMTAMHLRELAGMAQPGRGIIPLNQDRLEPLSAIYPREAAVAAQNALSSQDVSMTSFSRELLRQQLLKEYVLGPGQAAFYSNVNAPEDLR